MNIKDVEMGYMSTNLINSIKTTQEKEVVKNKIAEKSKQFIKRFIDILGGLVGIFILIPLIIGVYIINLICGDRGPIFYSQKRIGKNGKYFKIYKFRTMVMDADKKLAKLLEEDNEMKMEYKKYKKLKNDPRITKMGGFLRETSLDEFPQFWNVLKGEMSLVGPRPYLPREKEDMGDFYEYVIKCKPGITGLWQTSGRSDVSFEERLHMDLEYYKNNSLETDFKLLSKTVANVVKRKGAA